MNLQYIISSMCGIALYAVSMTPSLALACDANGCQAKWNKIFNSGLFDDATVDSDIKKEAAEIASSFKVQCPCFVEEKPRLVIEKLDPILPGLQMKAASYTSQKTQTKPQVNTSAFERADVKCPADSKHVGELPPDEFASTLGKSFEVYCEKDGKRHGPYIAWANRGVKDSSGKWRYVKASEGEFWKDQKVGPWNLFTDKGTLQETAEFPTVASLEQRDAEEKAAEDKQRLAEIEFQKKEEADKLADAKANAEYAQRQARELAEAQEKIKPGLVPWPNPKEIVKVRGDVGGGGHFSHLEPELKGLPLHWIAIDTGLNGKWIVHVTAQQQKKHFKVGQSAWVKCEARSIRTYKDGSKAIHCLFKDMATE